MFFDFTTTKKGKQLSEANQTYQSTSKCAHSSSTGIRCTSSGQKDKKTSTTMLPVWYIVPGTMVLNRLLWSIHLVSGAEQTTINRLRLNNRNIGTELPNTRAYVVQVPVLALARRAYGDGLIYD